MERLVRRLETVQMAAAKKVIENPRTRSSVALRAESGMYPLETETHKKKEMTVQQDRELENKINTVDW